MNLSIPYRYTPRNYQIQFLSAMDSGKKRACLVWHRRCGKTRTVLNLVVKKMFERIGTYFHCFPEYGQGRKVLWDGIAGDAMKYLDHFPRQIVAHRRNQEMQITLVNGSIYQIIGADNYDSVIGANPVGLVFDEWAISDKYPTAWDYFRPILVENGGWAVFPYTPRGMNHGYTLYEMAKNNPEWFCQRLTIEDTDVVSISDIQAERDAGMSDDMIAQEFYCDFTVVGSRPFQFSRLHHVTAPRDIPRDAPLYMGFDWGFGAPFSVVWVWTDADGRIWQFGEWYGWSGTPNVGLRLEDSVIAQGIKEREHNMGIDDRQIIRLAGHDCWNKKPDYKGGGQGPSTAEVFANHGIYLVKGDPSRELKLRQFRERLRIHDDIRPMLQIYNTCEQTIRTLPLITTDPSNVEDVDIHGENHCYDALCHIAMARPLGPAVTLRVKTEAEARIDYLENPTILDPLEREMMEMEREFDRDDILGDLFFSDWDEPGRRELVYTSTVE